MPQTLYCDEGDGIPASYMISNLDNGEMIAICAQHWPAWIRTLADALPPGPEEMPAEEAVAVQETALGVGAALAPPRPKRRRQGRENGSAALDSEASPFPDPAPVDS